MSTCEVVAFQNCGISTNFHKPKIRIVYTRQIAACKRTLYKSYCTHAVLHLHFMLMQSITAKSKTKQLKQIYLINESF